jgi:hypothetical protein
MLPEPFADFETSGLTEDHRRVVELSREQFRRHGRNDAAIVWKGPAVCAAVTYGQKGWLPVMLALTDDGMCYCNTARNDGLLWCVSVRPPNACRVKNGAFWISKLDGSEADAKLGRVHPFMAHFGNPGDTVAPYLGALAIVKGRKGTRRFKELLQSLGAELE